MKLEDIAKIPSGTRVLVSLLLEDNTPDSDGDFQSVGDYFSAEDIVGIAPPPVIKVGDTVKQLISATRGEEAGYYSLSRTIHHITEDGTAFYKKADGPYGHSPVEHLRLL